MILKDAFVSINSVDLSDHVRSVNMDLGVEPQDDTAMGDDTRSAEAGLLIYSATVEFYQDFAAGKVDATLFPLLGAAGFPVIVRAVNTGGVGPTNPNYVGNMILTKYPPVTGTVGDEHLLTCEFAAAGDISRATA
jgi:hypothetical protein